MGKDYIGYFRQWKTSDLKEAKKAIEKVLAERRSDLSEDIKAYLTYLLMEAHGLSSSTNTKAMYMRAKRFREKIKNSPMLLQTFTVIPVFEAVDKRGRPVMEGEDMKLAPKEFMKLYNHLKPRVIRDGFLSESDIKEIERRVNSLRHIYSSGKNLPHRRHDV